MEQKKARWFWIIVILAVVAWAALRDPDALRRVLRWVGRVVAPFAWGGATAFVLHVPLRAIEKRLPRRWKRCRRAVALLLTLLSVLAVLAWVVGLGLPQLAGTAASLTQNLPHAWQTLCDGVEQARQHWPLVDTFLYGWQPPAWEELGPLFMENLNRGGHALMNSTVNAAQQFISGAVDFCVGLAFALYLLAQKEVLAVQCRMMLYAFLSRQRAEELLEVADLAEKTFSRFLSGQCLEACILGGMFAVGMLICRMPYVTLVSVLVAITALVPIFGSFVGCAAGALLIAVQRPIQAVWFVVLFLCIQQIEGSLVYPRVVGSSVGLPPIWVLAAVTIGGNLFGVAGILVMIPLCSVLYALLRRVVRRRLYQRQIPRQKYHRDSQENP